MPSGPPRPVLFALSLAAVATLTGAPRPAIAQSAQSAQSALDSMPYEASETARTAERALRRHAGDGHAWLAPDGPGRAGEVIAALRALEAHGLEAEHYATDSLASQLDRLVELDADARDRLDARLTAALALAADHLAHGRLTASELRDTWHLDSPRRDVGAALVEALDGDADVTAAVVALAPSHDDYRALLAAMAASNAAVPTSDVPDGPVLTEGARADPERLAALRKALQRLGFSPGDGPEDVYDEKLSAAVTAFQKSRDISTDGIVGPQTMRTINQRTGDSTQQIAMNLERWRWLPIDLGDPHLWVNVPEYRLQIVEGGDATSSMKVIVGEEGWGTPALTESVETIVLNPYWNVPVSITVAEMLPKIRRDPGYLAEKQLEVLTGWGPGSRVVSASEVDWASLPASEDEFPYRLRQTPGPANSLGRLKFISPNEEAIYLHDTPQEQLFGETQRGLSHGCVRVERPYELARHLLDGRSDWTLERVREQVDSGETERISLSPAHPLHFVYFTVTPADDEGLAFHPDPYGLDEDLAEMIEAKTRSAGSGSAS